ncbi:cytochrome d ubiquinol oxidase subunit II [Thalassotalea piscium]|uniref:Cytochrome d ubiquinol oxidase subunit II n=1 Tax=Thalassotalea piscium TaxID=1230533 RepID=A0A7X0NIW3_9GAMM|nr:cytochrome d ubiquinol oxidase subunit II [Thalassotalea piscium]MBB6544240.1 cytochrome d ubiquinol oxidase subunit II [Thalassotalea piscium]
MNIPDNDWLPAVFLGLMALSFLVYAILDGYDLGVGVLLPSDTAQENNQQHRDMMIYSIGPFWDANETWLVMAIGLLLIAFPSAYSIILQALYLPTALMLVGLILRGVSFDFRTKAPSKNKTKWDLAFKAGSLLTTLSQGYMLGRYVTGFENTTFGYGFSILASICVTAGYSFIGAAWLVMRTEGKLQIKAARWAIYCNTLMAIGIIAVCLTNLFFNKAIMDKWLSFPQVFVMIPMSFLLIFLFSSIHLYLTKVPTKNDVGCWFPFVCATLIFILSFLGLAYSFYPYIIWQKITIWEAASARNSLMFIFIGAVIVLPTIIAYTIFSYRVFWGKTTKLNY